MDQLEPQREFIADIYVYAKRDGEFSIGAYDMLCDGGRVEAQVLKYPKNTQELSSTYVATLHKAFLRAADHVGKYAIPVIDPSKEILVKHGERLNGRKAIKAKFIFRFHIVDERALAMVRCDGGITLTPMEEKWKNLMKLLILKISRTKTPYRNLNVRVQVESLAATAEEVSDIAEYADRELQYTVDDYKQKHAE